jgi:hypothetical protein
MTMLDFPSSPTLGETYGDWIWDGEKWTGNLPQAPGAFSYTTAAFNIPVVGSPVSVPVEQIAWVGTGMVVFISGMYGAVQDAANDVLTLLRISAGSAGTDEAITNVTIPAGTLVTAGGWPGPAGPPGPALPVVSLQPSVPTSADLPTTGNRPGDGRIAEDTGDLWIWDGTQWYNTGPLGGVPGPPGPPFTPPTTGTGDVFVLQTGAQLLNPTLMTATLGSGTTVLAGMSLSGGLTVDSLTASGTITGQGQINAVGNIVSTGNIIASNGSSIPSFTLLGPSSSFYAMGATAGYLIFGVGSAVTGGLVSSLMTMDSNGNVAISTGALAVQGASTFNTNLSVTGNFTVNGQTTLGGVLAANGSGANNFQGPCYFNGVDSNGNSIVVQGGNIECTDGITVSGHLSSGFGAQILTPVLIAQTASNQSANLMLGMNLATWQVVVNGDGSFGFWQGNPGTNQWVNILPGGNTYFNGAVYMNVSSFINGDFTPGSNGNWNCGAISNAWSNVYSYNYPSPSDARLKKNVHVAPAGALDVVDKVVVRQFNYNQEPEGAPQHRGVMATELQAALPSGEAAVMVGDDEKKTLSVNLPDMIGLLWQAMQELSTRLTTLEGRVS